MLFGTTSEPEPESAAAAVIVAAADDQTIIPTPLSTEPLVTQLPPVASETETVPADTPIPTEMFAEVVPTEAPARKPTREPIRVRTHRDILYNDTSNEQLDIYQPQIEESQLPLPTLFLMEGGFYENPMSQRRSLENSADYFARQGYAVVVKAGSTGTNYPFYEQHALCALAWIHANADTYGFDRERIVPISFFGGLAAFLGTVDEPERFMEDCPHPLPEGDLVSGVITIEGEYDYSIWIPQAENLGFEGYYNYFGFPTDHMENVEAVSPISWVDGSEPPFLLIHSTGDRLVDPAQSEMFAALLTEAGVQVELIQPDVIVDDNSNFDDPVGPHFTSVQVRTLIKNFLADLFSE